MSFEHRTFGWNAFDGLLAELGSIPDFCFEVSESPYQPATPMALCKGRDEDLTTTQPLRIMHYEYRRSGVMVAEEILVIDDRDCDGCSIVSTITYPLGERPNVPPPIVRKP